MSKNIDEQLWRLQKDTLATGYDANHRLNQAHLATIKQALWADIKEILDSTSGLPTHPHLASYISSTELKSKLAAYLGVEE